MNGGGENENMDSGSSVPRQEDPREFDAEKG